MKAVKSISLFFATATCCVLFGFLLALMIFWNGRDFSEPQVYYMPGVTEEAPEVSEADVQVSQWNACLRSDAEFVMKEIDVRKGTVHEVISRLPSQYAGMDRETFLECMERYDETPPLSERQKGFLSLEVLSFASERVVVQKNYRKASPEDGFYLAVIDHRVVVLFDDGKTLYMTTDVTMDMLPSELQEELATMIYLKDQQALFDFLEAYTS